MTAAHLARLNDDQRRAVEFGVTTPDRGPLLVIAGAGSGKTNTLAHRVAHLILNGADPRRILLMTFSRRAASEMAKRVERIAAGVLGSKGGVLTDALAWSGTFHGVGAKILREHAQWIGLDPAFTIHDREDSADLMNLVRHERGLSKKESRFPAKGTCLAIYSRVVNSETTIDEVLVKVFPWCAMWKDELKALFAAYVEAKQAQNVLDYDDLLLYWAYLMAEPSISGEIAARFDHVLVDEYQDTNRLQASVLLGLKPKGDGLTVVGDDAQSIYSFRAATVRNILDFPGHFSPPAEIVTLERNYRSTQPILAAANGVISLATERFTKNLWTERESGDKPQLVTVRGEAEQARYVVETVLEARERGVALKEQAVMFRASHHSRPARIRADPAQHPVREVRRAEIPRCGACEGPARRAALRREPARPRRRFSRRAIVARSRAGDGWQDAGIDGRRRRSGRGLGRVQAAAEDLGRLAGFRRAGWRAAPGADGLAG
jgi:DNA helicase-2/ATP-dependent DNA helicase PcrA